MFNMKCANSNQPKSHTRKKIRWFVKICAIGTVDVCFLNMPAEIPHKYFLSYLWSLIHDILSLRCHTKIEALMNRTDLKKSKLSHPPPRCWTHSTSTQHNTKTASRSIDFKLRTLKMRNGSTYTEKKNFIIIVVLSNFGDECGRFSTKVRKTLSALSPKMKNPRDERASSSATLSCFSRFAAKGRKKGVQSNFDSICNKSSLRSFIIRVRSTMFGMLSMFFRWLLTQLHSRVCVFFSSCNSNPSVVDVVAWKGQTCWLFNWKAAANGGSKWRKDMSMARTHRMGGRSHGLSWYWSTFNPSKYICVDKGNLLWTKLGFNETRSDFSFSLSTMLHGRPIKFASQIDRRVCSGEA